MENRDNESKNMLNYYELLRNMARKLQNDMQAKASGGKKISMTGTEFEKMVYGALIDAGIKKENIRHSTQKFPDFIITDPEKGGKIGVEVKKTDSAKWEVIGGSIYESLKNDTDETYVVMAKLGGKLPEVRLKKYVECIADLKVTHSPRFYLDLDIEEGEDYLTARNSEDLLELSGEELNKRIRQLLRSNKSTWWSGAETTAFSDLSAEEKDAYFVDGVVLFPEVFGGDYERFTPWLVYSCFVWCKNVRDVFSAGGTRKVKDNDIWVSAVMRRTIEKIDVIKKRIDDLTDDEIRKFWKIEDTRRINKRQVWASLMRKYLKISNKLIENNRKYDIEKNRYGTDISELLKNEYYEYVCSLLN